jgi:hypothetical protein
VGKRKRDGWKKTARSGICEYLLSIAMNRKCRGIKPRRKKTKYPAPPKSV